MPPSSLGPNDVPLYGYTSTGGHVGRFHFLALVDNAALDVRAHVFVCGPFSHTVFISLGSVPEWNSWIMG